jgi:hypothetical protein
MVSEFLDDPVQPRQLLVPPEQCRRWRIELAD